MEKKLNEVTLICLDESNVQIYLALFSPVLWPYLHVANLDDEKAYLLDCLARKHRGVPTFFYLIYDNTTDTYVGAVQIRLPHENKGQLYCWINEKYWGRGYLKPAIELAAENYFKETDLSEFSALVYCDNQRSYHALKKVGFIEVGTTTGPYGQQHILLFMRNIKGNV